MNFEKFHTELGQTLEFIKYSNNVPRFKEMLSELKGKVLQNETISTINLFTGANIKTNEKKEVTDVCYALEVIKQEYAEEAVAKAMAKELTNSVENVMTKFQISLEEACETLKHTVTEYNKAKEQLEQAKPDAKI